MQPETNYRHDGSRKQSVCKLAWEEEREEEAQNEGATAQVDCGIACHRLHPLRVVWKIEKSCTQIGDCGDL
jgi:hypothetical protein